MQIAPPLYFILPSYPALLVFLEFYQRAQRKKNASVLQSNLQHFPICCCFVTHTPTLRLIFLASFRIIFRKIIFLIVSDLKFFTCLEYFVKVFIYRLSWLKQIVAIQKVSLIIKGSGTNNIARMLWNFHYVKVSSEI